MVIFGPHYYFGITNKLFAAAQAAKKLVAASNLSVNGDGNCYGDGGMEGPSSLGGPEQKKNPTSPGFPRNGQPH